MMRAALTARAAGGSSILHLLTREPMRSRPSRATIAAAATQPHPIQSLAFLRSVTAILTSHTNIAAAVPGAGFYLIRSS